MHRLRCIAKRSRISLVLCVTAGLASLSTLSSSPAYGESLSLLRFVEGVDSAPTPMADSEVRAQLNDPWATLILRQGTFPPNLEQALAALNQLNSADGGLPEQQSYFVSESGHIPVDASSSALQREFRMVITRGGAMASQPSILISAPAGQRAGFIELMSWDQGKRAFNFYRRSQDAQWTWKGDTRDALRPATHLQGCFACHVNGVPIMKELRLPWNNWHSQAASIPGEAIPDKAISQGPLFLNKSGAEHLELVVRGWIDQATATRIADVMQGDTVTEAPTLLRPLFETTTVNLTASSQTSERTTPTLDLPSRGFFLNSDILSGVLGLNVPSPPSFKTVVQRTLYTNTLTKFDFRLEDGAFIRKGDTHFAFFVPAPAQEDVTAIRLLIAQQVITQPFATCVLMVDFPNPIFSAARSRLLQYVPATGHIQAGRSDLAERTAQAIVQAAMAQAPESPEGQFAALWQLSPTQLQKEAEKRIKQYLNAVQKRLKTQAGLDDYTRLAEARRRQFATVSALNEFPLLLPKTNIPPMALQMHADGTVRP
jgi:hypothetical protein